MAVVASAAPGSGRAGSARGGRDHGRCCGSGAPSGRGEPRRGSPRGGQCPAAAVSVESEGQEALEVDRGGAVGQPETVAVDAEVAHASVAASDEPRDGALDHRAMLPVAVLPVRIGRGVTSGGVDVVVRDDTNDTADSGDSTIARGGSVDVAV